MEQDSNKPARDVSRENGSANSADQDSAKRDKEAARSDVPASTEKDKWGDLQGQQGGQGWKDR
jgi:hypothetical protein